ncbi:MAG TPA: diguanylate cyclase [Bryobacteraceae bacterium]
MNSAGAIESKPSPQSGPIPPEQNPIIPGFLTVVIVAGMMILIVQMFRLRIPDVYRFGSFALLASAAAGFKIALPGMTGTLSANFLFILYGLVEFTLPETTILGCFLTLMQCVWHQGRRTPLIKTAFNVGTTALAIQAADFALNSSFTNFAQLEKSIQLMLGASVFFFVHNLPVAAVISLSEGKRFAQVWRECYQWAFPYYLLGAAMAGLASLASRYVGWQTAVLIVPLVYLIYRSYCMYLGRLDDEKHHAEDMAGLHLRTIEALALAIEAKDNTTHDQLHRVQLMSTLIAGEMNLPHDQIEAVRAAALLHDIGKLAVPEHIISKPGPLTAEEFEKMKIHPTVGAEILERVQFPYPVEPIVRCHHEKWDGTGYPGGLKGDAIPIGARILAAVEALETRLSGSPDWVEGSLKLMLVELKSQAGKAFDPAVIAALEHRAADLERIARIESPTRRPGALNPATTALRRAVPAAGFEATAPTETPEDKQADFLHSIASARQEVQTLFELSQDLGNSLSLDETLSVLAARLRKIIPHHTVAIYTRRADRLVAEYVNGDEYRLFSSLEIPLGQGLSGWVAERHQAIINGNPSVEPGYLNDSTKFSSLRSALAVPLEGLHGLMGVLTLYHAEKDAFSKDHLRILMAISSKVALSIENAIKFRQAEDSATCDYLTGLPNARSMFLHLESEISRAQRGDERLAILVCDLDGFKQVNDRFGHIEGNRVLRSVAAGLKGMCRDYDYVARMGGDEFVVILPGLKPEDAQPQIARFQQVAVQSGIEVCGSEVLAMSVGMANYPEDGKDVETLLAEADRRMYKEKHESKHKRQTEAATGIQWQGNWPSTAVQ